METPYHISFFCPACDHLLDTPRKKAGDAISCVHCQHQIIVPFAPIGPGVYMKGYRIIRKLGSGGMGDVYLAQQQSMNRNVAIKILQQNLVKDRRHLDLFMQEIRNQGIINHPNMATAYDAGKHQDMYYLVLEYVRGYSLQQMIENTGRIPVPAALKITLEAARGLNYAWEKHHMVHRDIKPSNIMVHEDRGVKVLDLGVATSLRQITHNPEKENIIIGTPGYMAPEQALEGKEIDFRADIYALGATLYHMLCNAPPLEGKSITSMLNNNHHWKLTPIEKINPNVPLSCRSLISRMTAFNIDDRFSSWIEVIHELNRIRAELNTPVRSHKNTNTTRKSSQKNILPTIILTVITTLSGFTAGWLASEKYHQDTPSVESKTDKLPAPVSSDSDPLSNLSPNKE